MVLSGDLFEKLGAKIILYPSSKIYEYGTS
jgi:hypothetical protein